MALFRQHFRTVQLFCRIKSAPGIANDNENHAMAYGTTNLSGKQCCESGSVPFVYWHPGSGSGSVSQRYGSGSLYHQAKIVRKPAIPTDL
jgi:hypothetical protein